MNQKLLGMIGHRDVLTVENALWQPDIDWLENIPERQYTKLLIQLSVALVRIRKGLPSGVFLLRIKSGLPFYWRSECA